MSTLNRTVSILKQNGVNLDYFPRLRVKGCMLQRGSAFIVGPEGELYKCWNNVSDIDKAIGSIMDNDRHNYVRLMNYMHECGPFGAECKDCSIFPICDGGCGMTRYRNKFENGEFKYCSIYKDSDRLEQALISSIDTPSDVKHKKRLRM